MGSGWHSSRNAAWLPLSFAGNLVTGLITYRRPCQSGLSSKETKPTILLHMLEHLSLLIFWLCVFVACFGVLSKYRISYLSLYPNKFVLVFQISI